jgi:TIR domain-containing protein
MQAFISYAHDDHRALENFSAHLKPVARAFKIDVWADKRISPGHHWNQKIRDAITASDIHILLMSNSFFCSDYIFDHELPAIVSRQQAGALTIPVLIERCYWSAFIGILQAVPMNPAGKLVPINEWKPHRRGFLAASEQIATSIQEHFGLAPASPFREGAP